MLTITLLKSIKRGAMDKVLAEKDLAAGFPVNAETAPHTAKIIDTQAIISLHGFVSTLTKRKIIA